MPVPIFLIVLFIIIVFLAIRSIRIVRQSEVCIIERLGRFHKVADAGVNIIVPFIDNVRAVVTGQSMRNVVEH